MKAMPWLKPAGVFRIRVYPPESASENDKIGYGDAIGKMIKQY